MMRQIIQRLFSLKRIVIPFLVIGILCMIQPILNHLSLVYWPMRTYMHIIQVIELSLFYILGVWIWVSMALVLPTFFLLIPFTCLILGIIMGTLGWEKSYPLLGIGLLMVASGFPPLYRYRHHWLIASLVYVFVGCIFWGLLEIGILLLIGFGLLVAGLTLYKKYDHHKLIIAYSTVVIPSLLAIVFLGLFLDGTSSVSERKNGLLLSPWGDNLVFEQKISHDLIDRNLAITIYKPLRFGFFRIVGRYASEFYGTIDLNSSDFTWELVDDTTYNLYITSISMPILVDSSDW